MSTEVAMMCLDHFDLWLIEHDDAELVSPLECQHPQCDDDRHLDHEESGCPLCERRDSHDHDQDEYGSFSEDFFEDQHMRGMR